MIIYKIVNNINGKIYIGQQKMFLVKELPSILKTIKLQSRKP